MCRALAARAMRSWLPWQLPACWSSTPSMHLARPSLSSSCWLLKASKCNDWWHRNRQSPHPIVLWSMRWPLGSLCQAGSDAVCAKSQVIGCGPVPAVVKWSDQVARVGGPSSSNHADMLLRLCQPAGCPHFPASASCVHQCPRCKIMVTY